MTQRLNERSGFTLLELLMVVIIIGILASLALPAFFRATEKARSAEAQIILGQIRGAVQRYCVENNYVASPGAFGELDVEVPVGGTAQWSYTFGTATCPGGGIGTPIIVGMVATRNGGPCVGSTITMNDPTPLGSSIFVPFWAIGTPCA